MALKKYPAIVDAMAKRSEVYNQEKEYVFAREREGSAFVICPDSDLGISRTEHNPDELQRVYDQGRKVANNSLSAVISFLKS